MALPSGQSQPLLQSFMLEYVGNKEADHASSAANYPDGWPALRSDYAIVKGSGWGTRYGNYKYLPFQYGSNHNTGIIRCLQHNLCIDSKPEKTVDRLVHDHAYADKRSEMGVDRLLDRNSCYIHPTGASSLDYPDICTFVQISFTHSGNVKIWYNEDIFWDFHCNILDGLGVRRDKPIGFNIYGLISLLSLPRQLRKKTAYTARLVRMVYSGSVQTARLKDTYWDDKDFDWIKVAGANYGLSLQWKPHQASSWFENFFKNIVTIGLGFVPGIGPLLSVSFALAWTAITDPDSFIEVLRNQIPAADLTMEAINELKKNAQDTRAYLPSGWKQAGRSMQIPPEEVAKLKSINEREEVGPMSLDEIGPRMAFLLAGEMLVQTARSPTSEPEVVQDGSPAEVLVSVRATEADDPPYEELLAEKRQCQGKSRLGQRL